ncbi:S46 family peptidase [uncultured Ferrimonas sp.]|uniref:S46 family peptidase n=1 Tax=uncultured Ferrimonas sp. TaxID=432640 RepID=UPI0026076223|nr:S46 family peptidase [uncultured Ferrimonas sp.]
MLLASALFSAATTADEGQWLPHQLPQLSDQLTQKGIELPAEQLADLTKAPMNAVVGLGYCTASFVSPKGLVLTNHHCAYNAIQYNSRDGANYLADGFIATSQNEERSAGPQERLYITDKVVEVTDKVYQNVSDGQTGFDRHQTIEANRKQLLAQCEADPAYRCRVASYHGGLQYYLLRQLVIRDVRLVYAPPESVGAYGGDIDNFEYPRHSGDFAFLRAYVAPDGSPAGYHADNVPYQPAGYLPIAADGVASDEGILVAGYPGRTSRHQLSQSIEFASGWLYPVNAQRYQARIDAIEAQTDPQVRIAYASKRASWANRMKKYNGLLDGFRKTDIVGFKADTQAAFSQYLRAEEQLPLLAAQEQGLLASQQHYQANFYYQNAQSGALLQAANRLYKWAKQQQLTDAERDIGFQSRDRKMVEGRLKRIDKSFIASMDQQLWQMDIDAYQNQPLRDTMLDQQLAQLDLGKAYQTTSLLDSQARLAWLDRPASEFEQSNDPFIRMAVALYQQNQASEHQRKSLAGELDKSRPALMAALLAWYQQQGKPVYPDANGTLRISYGSVDGYQAADALYKQPFTYLNGILEKHTGQYPFNAPSKVVDAIKAGKFGQFRQYAQTKPSWYCTIVPCASANQDSNARVPVNFLSSADTTGGNSGSPVINGKGQLVGVNFDSTYESITKDWYFNAEITRAVHVDIRYILWMLSEVDQANYVLDELSLIRR